MRVVEQFLEGKNGQPDGGEDRIVVTEHFAAIIDGATAKTKETYLRDGQKMAPGKIAVEVLQQGVRDLDPDMNPFEACMFLDDRIMQAYEHYDIVGKVKNSATERFTAVMALYNVKHRYLGLYGECQALVDNVYYQPEKIVDTLHANARATHLIGLISRRELTLEDLAKLPVDEDPGRRVILAPPTGSAYPGLVGQEVHQNQRGPYGFFALDGFADISVNGYQIVEVPQDASQLVLATDGFPIADGQDPAQVLGTLAAARENTAMIMAADPFLFTLYRATKGPGTNKKFDDQGYLRLAL